MTQERSEEEKKANEEVKKLFLELEEHSKQDAQHVPELWEEMRRRLRKCGINV